MYNTKQEFIHKVTIEIQNIANKLFKINDKTNAVLNVRLLIPIKTDVKKLTAKTIVDLLKQEIETNEVEFAIM